MVTMRWGMRRAIENLPVLRGYTETRHKAQSWDRERRTVARIEVTKLGLDIRFVVTSLDVGLAEWISAFMTQKARMGATHFLTKTLPKVAAEIALSVLAYNLTRVMNIVGTKPLMAAIVA